MQVLQMTVSFITTDDERELLKSNPSQLDAIHKIAVERAGGRQEESVTKDTE